MVVYFRPQNTQVATMTKKAKKQTNNNKNTTGYRLAKRGPFKMLYIRIFEALVIGIISGLIVTCFISRPNISILDTQPLHRDGLLDVVIRFENTGNSVAKNIKIYSLWATKNSGQVTFPPDIIGPNIEPGDILSTTMADIPSGEEKIYLLYRIEYSDSSILRKCFNFILRTKNKKQRWGRYNPDRDMIELAHSDDSEFTSKYKKLEDVFDNVDHYRNEGMTIIKQNK